MSEFTKALVSESKSAMIPEEYNYFGALIGAWDFEWIDGRGTEKERHIKGEWIFSWVLLGTTIQDIFICPSREEQSKNKYPDAEYGTTIRFYNPKSNAWDIFYGCTCEATRLTAEKEDGRIVLTENTDRKMKWVFSDIAEHSFHWQNISTEDGTTWKVNGELFATRKALK